MTPNGMGLLPASISPQTLLSVIDAQLARCG
jgi:hypothetical protein